MRNPTIAPAGGRPDAVLIPALRAGDADAYGILAERYGGELRLHCYRMLGSLDTTTPGTVAFDSPTRQRKLALLDATPFEASVAIMLSYRAKPE